MNRAALFFLLLVACSTEKLTPAQQEYQTACLANNDPFMLMSEVNEGQVVGPSCHGCMPDERHHICTLAEYEQFKSTGEVQ